MLRISTSILILLTSVGAFAQSHFQNLGVTSTNLAAPGYFLIAPNSTDSIGLMDHTGHNVRTLYTGTVSTLQSYSNKYITYFTVLRTNKADCFVVRDQAYNIVDSFSVFGKHSVDFHEGKVFTDSTYLILGTDYRTMDLSGVVPGGRTNANVYGAIIQERTFSGRVLFEWKSLDYIPVTDATSAEDLTQSSVDYIHVNSVNPTSDGNFLVSCRHLDEVIKISRKNGEIMWRLGGRESKHNQFTFLNDTTDGFFGFSHQHSAIETSRGTIALFDNGNLKSQQPSSRAVEFAVDVSRKTAKKVWERSPLKSNFSVAMGSVEELPNGSFLIGYGRFNAQIGSATVVAEEVTQSGKVAVSITNGTNADVTSFRVSKSTFGMAGCYKSVNAPGTYDFSCNDSTTYMQAKISAVSQTADVVVERHNYQPHNIGYSGSLYCGVLPMRWVVRVDDATKITGQMILNVGSIASVEAPDNIKLLYRQTEGQGTFKEQGAVYSSKTKRFETENIRSGEYMLAYQECVDPTPTAPTNGSVEVPYSSKISWTPAAVADGYNVEISKTSDFASPVRLTTARTDTTIGSLDVAQMYYWRVRRVNGFNKGPWSAPFHFTTQLGIPQLISPVAVKDTVATLYRPTFRWKKATGAEKYKVTVTDTAFGYQIIDVITDADSLVPAKQFSPNTPYYWVVRSLSGATVGQPSTKQFFITAPAAPTLLTPKNDTLLPYASSQQFTWNLVPGAMKYAITLMYKQTRKLIKRDTVPGPWGVVSNIPEKTELAWTVTAIGKYGAGVASSEYRFSTFSTVPLTAPETIDPNNVDNIDARDSVSLSWTTVPDATVYHLQITAGSTFDTPTINVSTLKPTYSFKELQPGTMYSWRVKAENDHVVSPWSDTARFITVPQSTTALVPLWPRIATEDEPLTGTCRFTIGSEFEHYDVQFARTPAFDTLEQSFSTTSNTVDYLALKHDTRYFWRVVGMRKDSSTKTGPFSFFTTIREASGVDDEQNAAIVIRFLNNGLLVTSSNNEAFTVHVSDILGRELARGSVGGNSTEMLPLPSGYRTLFVLLTNGRSGRVLHRTLYLP